MIRCIGLVCVCLVIQGSGGLGAQSVELLDEHQLAVMTIVGEAEGEPFEGQVAVGEVIRNRMKHGVFSDGTVYGTVLHPKQFACWESNARLQTMFGDLPDRMVERASTAWEASLYSNITQNATHFYNPTMGSPTWAAKMTQTTQIGGHVFLTGF